jgi:dienelactone hydrolase
MKRLFTLLTFCLCSLYSLSQVKSNYIYSTSMPYGTLDLRTKITSTHYYYLRENETFAFRESSPGVRTNSYLDMTSFDSSPYTQGHLRLKNGTSDKFMLNYRLLKPNNYQSTYTQGYPLIVIMHGAVERGNCYYNACYHSNFSYDPNINSPAAPKTSTHKLLNNDHHVSIGGKQHLDARTLAGTKLPNDPTLAAKAFQGFVLMPQMMNIWDSLNVQDVIRTVRLLQEKYKIDPNRIYIHGLSIGGYAVYQAIKRAPWMFAAALPMSAVTEAAYIFKHNQQNKVAHIPLWVFQGGTDTNPTPSFTQNIINKFKAAGATPRYTVYSSTGHIVWNKAYAEADFFPWIKAKNKANLHAYKGITTIIKSKNQYPKLMLAEGFFAYQWEKNGVIISGAASNTYTVTTPGTYRARFSRISSAPTASQWNIWSAPVTINETTTTTAAGELVTEIEAMPENLDVEVYPNPTTADNIQLSMQVPGGGAVRVKLFDQMGRSYFEDEISGIAGTGEASIQVSESLPDGIYLLSVSDGKSTVMKRVVIRNNGH